MSRSYAVPHEFDEDVEDYSMCMCGVPAMVHYFVEPDAHPCPDCSKPFPNHDEGCINE